MENAMSKMQLAKIDKQMAALARKIGKLMAERQKIVERAKARAKLG